jgi:hypothetical protein
LGWGRKRIVVVVPNRGLVMDTKKRIMITNKNTACGSELMVSHSEYVLAMRL